MEPNMVENKETEPLMKIAVAAEEFAQNEAPTKPVAMAGGEEEREWDGHLLQCCGKRDRHGYSAFSSTLLCFPRTLSLNSRAILKSGYSKVLLISAIFMILSGAMWINQIGFTVDACRPEPRSNPQPKPKVWEEQNTLIVKPHDPEALLPEPQEKTFLAGATFNPAYLTDEQAEAKPQSSGFTVIVNGKETSLNELEATNEQIQLAKNQALEGLSQLSLGRKMLHKHHDDDEDDDDHEDKPKSSKKKCKHNKKNKKHEDDDDEDEEKLEIPLEIFERLQEEADIKDLKTLESRRGPDSPPLGPRDPKLCDDASAALTVIQMIFVVASVMVTLSGYKLRVRTREQFNIKGSPTRDFFAWSCCLPCAVCQETRTLTKNNVEDGVWYGPTQLVQQIPPQQLMTQYDIPQKAIAV